jgi:hypothetical protein
MQQYKIRKTRTDKIVVPTPVNICSLTSPFFKVIFNDANR